jgi:hypothetical protein
MLRSFLPAGVCLPLMLFTSVAFAQSKDIQSLQYEFGQVVTPTETPKPLPVVVPQPCNCQPVVYAPVNRGCCYPACYAPCYKPCSYPVVKSCCPAPAPVVYRRACVRPIYRVPYYYGW